MTELAVKLHIPLKHLPRRHEDRERWAGDLAQWLLHRIDEPVALMLHGLQHAGIQEPVHTLVRALVRGRAADPTLGQLLRIVLLGYDGGMLERHGLAFKSQVLEFVDQTMIREWLKQRYQGKKDYQYEDTAAEIYDLIPTSGPMRMRAMCTQIQALGPELEEA